MTDKYHPRNHPLNCAYHVDQYPFECTCGLFAKVSSTCDLGVGCDETGTCYALAHGRPEMCGKANWDDKSAAVQIGHEIGMSAEDFTRLGDGIVEVLRCYRTEIVSHVRCEIIQPDGVTKPATELAGDVTNAAIQNTTLTTSEAFEKAAEIVQSRYDKAPHNNMGDQFAAAIDDLHDLAAASRNASRADGVGQ